MVVLAPATENRSSFMRILALAVLAGVAYLASGIMAVHFEGHLVPDSSYALLAVGDTGKRHRLVASLTEGQVAVANEMIREDRKHPVDAILMLGDIFYMRGLQEFELVPRIRENLVYPYCHFMRLEEPRSKEVASACRSGHAGGNPIPFHVVLGNHDFESEESPALQRNVIPEFIGDWSVPTEYAVARELTEGLSLVLFDSEVDFRSALEHRSLVAALRAAKGPWVIMAAHVPMAIGEFGNLPEVADHSLGFEQFVRGAIEESGVRVHLYLSGHHHSLQMVEGVGELGPAMHVIAGSGARWREIERPHPRRRFGLERLGFARIDLVGRGRDQKLVVSLFKSATIPLTAWGGPSLRARWSVDPDGRIRDLAEPRRQ